MLNDIEIEDVRLTLEFICDVIEKTFVDEEEEGKKIDETENKGQVSSEVFEVPKKGLFYEHDDRRGSDDEDIISRRNVPKKTLAKKGNIEERWQHDLFDADTQARKPSNRSSQNNRNRHFENRRKPVSTRNEKTTTSEEKPKNQNINKIANSNENESSNRTENKKEATENRNKYSENPHHRINDSSFQNKSFNDSHTTHHRYEERHGNEAKFPRTKSCNQIPHSDNGAEHDNREAPKKSYFLQRRKQHEHQQATNQVDHPKYSQPHGDQYPSSQQKSYKAKHYHEAPSQRGQKPKERGFYDDNYDLNNNYLNLPKSLSFSNSKYKSNESNNQIDEALSFELQSLKVQKQQNTTKENRYFVGSEDFVETKTTCQTSRPVVGQQRSEQHFPKTPHHHQPQPNYFQQTQSFQPMPSVQTAPQQRHFIALPPGIDLAHIISQQQQQQFQQAYMPQLDYQLTIQNPLYYPKN